MRDLDRRARLGLPRTRLRHAGDGEGEAESERDEPSFHGRSFASVRRLTAPRCAAYRSAGGGLKENTVRIAGAEQWLHRRL
jgi:hypothetical protein